MRLNKSSVHAKDEEENMQVACGYETGFGSGIDEYEFSSIAHSEVARFS
jgi:hypothetical protein